MNDCVKVVEEAYRAFGQNAAVMTRRVDLAVDAIRSIKIGGASINSLHYMGSFSYSAGFGKKGTNPSTTLLYDSETGQLKAFIESLHLKWFRTGATAAVAAKNLSNHKKSQTIGIFGTGRQARTQLMGLQCVYNISEVRAYSPTSQHREQFAQQTREDLGLNVVPVASPEKCAEDVDVIVTCSTSKNPVFESSWLSKGTHINVIGAHTRTSREIDTETMKLSKVVVESREQALYENGNLLIPINEGAFGVDKIIADLGEIVAGKVKCRTDENDNTVFLSGGVALDQIAIAAHVYETALKKNVGIELG